MTCTEPLFLLRLQRQQASGRLSRLRDQLREDEEATAPARADAVRCSTATGTILTTVRAVICAHCDRTRMTGRYPLKGSVMI